MSWYEASAYTKWLSRKTGKDYRLPTEAQWEKAARGDRDFQYPWGNTFDKDNCNAEESGLNRTSPVGIFPAGKSPYDCLDMAGNVWEWCFDWFDENYYKKSPAKNPQGPSKGEYRVLRGGSWGTTTSDTPSDLLRCASRHRNDPENLWFNNGFRVVCEINNKKRI